MSTILFVTLQTTLLVKNYISNLRNICQLWEHSSPQSLCPLVKPFPPINVSLPRLDTLYQTLLIDIVAMINFHSFPVVFSCLTCGLLALALWSSSACSVVFQRLLCGLLALSLSSSSACPVFFSCLLCGLLALALWSSSACSVVLQRLPYGLLVLVLWSSSACSVVVQRQLCGLQVLTLWSSSACLLIFCGCSLAFRTSFSDETAWLYILGVCICLVSKN